MKLQNLYVSLLIPSFTVFISGKVVEPMVKITYFFTIYKGFSIIKVLSLIYKR